MKLRNVPRNLPRYAKRFYYYRRNSSPFLSGDLFADQADVQMYSPKYRSKPPSLKDVADARVIFCPSHFLERFLEEYSNSISAKVLLLGNSDRDFDFIEMSELPKSLNQVFAQNLLNSSSSSRLLPIGIENVRLGTNGLLNLFSESFVNKPKVDRVLIGPYSLTNQERDFYLSSWVDESDHLEVIRGRLTPLQYAEVSSRFRFVASPRGNGLDTHRFWEALYRGSFPIVSQSSWSEQLSDLSIPHLQIQSWTLEGFHGLPLNTPSFSPNNVSPLWWPYWRSQIQAYL